MALVIRTRNYGEGRGVPVGGINNYILITVDNKAASEITRRDSRNRLRLREIDVLLLFRARVTGMRLTIRVPPPLAPPPRTYARPLKKQRNRRAFACILAFPSIYLLNLFASRNRIWNHSCL